MIPLMLLDHSGLQEMELSTAIHLPLHQLEFCDVADDFRGVLVFAGLDLADCNDPAALVLIAPIDGARHVKPTFWLPEGMRERARRDRVP